MQTQLFVTDLGDINVGIPELTYVVDVPILINNLNSITEEEMEKLEKFRRAVLSVYDQYSEGQVLADYDFETIIDD